MSRKPKYNYMQADGSWISFRKAMAPFAPKKKEFRVLRTKIIDIIGKETTPEFDDTLDFLITMLREKIFIHTSSTSVTAVQKELIFFIKQLTKTQKFLNENLSEAAQMYLTEERIKMMDNTDGLDAIYKLQKSTESVLEIFEKTKENIKGRKSSFTPHDMRQVLAEELARELDKMGIEPKKYRDGEFASILRLILEMIPCTVHKKRILVSIPNDLFEVVCDAIDSFPTKKPYSLLAFD